MSEAGRGEKNIRDSFFQLRCEEKNCRAKKRSRFNFAKASKLIKEKKIRKSEIRRKSRKN